MVVGSTPAAGLYPVGVGCTLAVPGSTRSVFLQRRLAAATAPQSHVGQGVQGKRDKGYMGRRQGIQGTKIRDTWDDDKGYKGRRQGIQRRTRDTREDKGTHAGTSTRRCKRQGEGARQGYSRDTTRLHQGYNTGTAACMRRSVQTGYPIAYLCNSFTVLESPMSLLSTFHHGSTPVLACLSHSSLIPLSFPPRPPIPYAVYPICGTCEYSTSSSALE